MSSPVTLQDRFEGVVALKQEAESEFSTAGEELNLGDLSAKTRALREEVEQFKQSTEELIEVASVGMIQRGDYESLLYMAEECGLDKELLLGRAEVVDGRVIALALKGLYLTKVVIAPGLTALQRLCLENNQLTEVHIPETLTALQRLYLENNQLTEVHVPETLVALRWLRLNNNQLTEVHLPETLTALKWLALDHNQFTEVHIPETLTALQRLYLENNQLTEVHIPETLTALKGIYLAHNQLTEVHIPNTLTALGVLYFNDNSLSQSRKEALKTHWEKQEVIVYV